MLRIENPQPNTISRRNLPKNKVAERLLRKYNDTCHLSILSSLKLLMIYFLNVLASVNQIYLSYFELKDNYNLLIMIHGKDYPQQ